MVIGFDDPEGFQIDDQTGCPMWRGHLLAPVFTDVQSLADEIASRRSRIICIDGHDGSGKSFLGRQLGLTLNATVVELDTFLTNRNTGAYVRYLDFDKLNGAIKRNASRLIVIEGVCLLAAVAQADISADCIVYVRKLSANWGNLWHDEAYHEPGDQEFDGSLQREIRAYNLQYEPLKRADFLFDRIETVD